MFWSSKIVKVLEQLLVVAVSILKVLRLRQPGMVFLQVVGEVETKKGNLKMLRFKLLLPVAGAADVTARTLSLQIGANEPQTVVLAGDAVETGEFTGNDGDSVVGNLIDSDDATPSNQSPPRDFSFVLVDTIAPPQPGDLGILITGEE